MNNGLLFFGGLLVVVLAALFAVPNFIDWNGYRGVFEEEASKVLGRDVRVGGTVNLRLLPVPYMRFEKIRIANLGGETGEPFVRAESFTMWLSSPALLRGVLEASEIELNKPVLTLAVDAQGGGNWTNITLKPGDLPFVPRDVALRSVKIIDGAISIFNAASERLSQIDRIHGELSADGLKGPFRFKGSAVWSGSLHDVNFASDVPASDGAFSLKASARADQSPNVYMLNGRLFDLAKKPVFKGDWTAKLAVPGSDTINTSTKSEPPVLDLTSQVTADALGAKFENIALILNAAEPQTINGSAAATWSASPRLDVALSSKWLDLDWVAGAGSGTASFAKLKQLALGLMQSVSGDSTATAKIDIQQVKVGGETAGGLSIDAERRGNTTHFKTFEASLPGGSRLDLSGDLKEEVGKLSFTGNAFLGGASLSRLANWASKSGLALDITADGAFSGGGKLDIDETRLALTDATGDISGHALAGDVTITNDERARIDVTLQAADLDSREFFPHTVAAIKSELRKACGLTSGDSGEQSVGRDMRLRIIADRVTDGEQTYRDVDVTFEHEGNEIRLPAAKLTTDRGLKIGLEGRVKSQDATPVGTLAYDVVGGTPEAIGELVRTVGLEGTFDSEHFKGLKEGKLAGLIRLGVRKAGAADVTFDGMLDEAHVAGFVEFDGGLANWRPRPSRTNVHVEAPSMEALLKTLGRSAPGTGSSQAGATRLVFVSAGTLGDGAQARLEVTSTGLSVNFSGSADWPTDSAARVYGIVDLKAADFADALALAGVSLPDGARGVAAEGKLDVAKVDGGWRIAGRDIKFGTSTLAGEVKVSAATGGSKIEGKLSTDRISVAGLLDALVDKSSAAPVPAERSAAANVAQLKGRPFWPDGRFNFGAFGGIEASLAVGFRSLELSGALSTREGGMQIKLTPSKASVNDLSASAAGGKLSGSVSLEKGGDGVSLSTKLTLEKASLTSLSSAAKGLASVEFSAEGRGQSPAGLIAVLAGSGEVKLQGAEIPGPSGSAESDVVEGVLQGKVQNDPRIISAGLIAALNSSKLPLGDRQLSIKVADGLVKFDTIAVDEVDGHAEVTTTADLGNLSFSAATQVTAHLKPLPPPPIALPGWQPPPVKGPLPPAVVLYDGPLDNLTAVKATADVATLQRELIVRQMERNVQLLEQSRRVDEERMRVEGERRNAQAAERAAAIAAERARKEAERLPPVIPDSAGTAEPQGAAPKSDMLPMPNTLPGPVPAPAAPQGSGGPAASTGSSSIDSDGGGVAADANQGSSSSSNASGNTILTPKITVEPIPPPQGAVQSYAAGGVTIDPQTGLPVAKPAVDTRPARPAVRPQQSRTSSDEVMKSLGGYP